MPPPRRPRRSRRVVSSGLTSPHSVRLSVMLLIGLAVMPLMALPAASAPRTASEIIGDEAYWISQAQVPPGRGLASGAIAQHVFDNANEGYVSPYDATIAARGMLLGGSRYHPKVKAWIDWYFTNLNWPDYTGLHGTVHDYRVNAHTGSQRLVIDPLTGQGRYDSTDAYAGVFLSLLRDYAERVPAGRSQLIQRRYLIDVIANAAIATKHANGLTGARPDWGGEYLLDNIDAEQGLRDYAWLAANVFDDSALAIYWQDEANSLQAAIERELWSPEKGLYRWASDQPSPSLGTFYPDATAQTWPIVYGNADPARRTALWKKFNQAWPQWSNSAANPGTPDPQPWPVLAVAAAVAGDRKQVLTYLERSQSTWIVSGRRWPWAVNDSALRAMAAAKARDSGWSA